MNLPNKLTLLRIILVPFFVAALLITAIPHRFIIALLIFSAASITDMLQLSVGCDIMVWSEVMIKISDGE